MGKMFWAVFVLVFFIGAMLGGLFVYTVCPQTITETEYITETQYLDRVEYIDRVEVQYIDRYIYTETPEPEVEYISLGMYDITAYCACVKCCGKSDGITATGTKATEGRTIAADPKVLPYGTKVIINDHEYIVEDCGGAVKGNRIDLFFDSHSEALQWGVQRLEVFVSK